MENVTCNLCHSDAHKPYRWVEGYALVMCTKCGLVYLNPRPDVQELAHVYSRQYHVDRVLTKEPETKEEIDQKVLQSQPMAAKIVRRFGSHGQLLDIGCGAGFFLAAMKRLGWSVTGVDVSEWASQFASENFQIDVYNGTMETIDIDGQFKVVTLFHSLEHMTDPLGALRKINQLVCSGGSVVIKGPNLAGFDRIWHGNKWRGYQPPFHLYHFTSKTYCAMLRKAGFVIETVKPQYFNLVDHFLEMRSCDNPRDDHPSGMQQSDLSGVYDNFFFKAIRNAATVISILLQLKGRDVTIYAKKRAN